MNTEQTFDQWLWDGVPTPAEEIAAFNQWLWDGVPTPAEEIAAKLQDN